MDMTRFRSREAQGIFEGDGAAYSRWAVWADRIRDAIHAAEERHQISSRGVPQAELQAIVDLCASDPVSAIHVVANDMLRDGARWTHLRLMRRLAGLADAPYPDMADVAGRHVAQVVRSLGWYDVMCRGPEPAPPVTIEVGFRRHSVECEDGDVIQVLADGATLRLELTEVAGGRGAAVNLDVPSAEELLAKLSELVPERAGRFGKGGIFLGDDGGEGRRTGLKISATNRGEPFREVVRFEAEGPGWETFASVEVGHDGVLSLVREVRRLLGRDASGPDAPAPGMR